MVIINYFESLFKTFVWFLYMPLQTILSIICAMIAVIILRPEFRFLRIVSIAVLQGMMNIIVFSFYDMCVGSVSIDQIAMLIISIAIYIATNYGIQKLFSYIHNRTIKIYEIRAIIPILVNMIASFILIIYFT